jgi:hypothetical protein
VSTAGELVFWLELQVVWHVHTDNCAVTRLDESSDVIFDNGQAALNAGERGKPVCQGRIDGGEPMSLSRKPGPSAVVWLRDRGAGSEKDAELRKKGGLKVGDLHYQVFGK